MHGLYQSKLKFWYPYCHTFALICLTFILLKMAKIAEMAPIGLFVHHPIYHWMGQYGYQKAGLNEQNPEKDQKMYSCWDLLGIWAIFKISVFYLMNLLCKKDGSWATIKTCLRDLKLCLLSNMTLRNGKNYGAHFFLTKSAKWLALRVV